MRNCQPERKRPHGDLPRLQELESAVQAEIKAIHGQEHLFLRSTSELTTLMKKMSRSNGRAYFRYVLRDVFGDKSNLYEPTTRHSPAEVRAYATSIIQRLVKAIHFAPLVLRAGCHYMLTEFRKAFPTCKQDTTIVVGNLLFLRIVCPALIKPEMFGFQPHTAGSLPVGVQVAKLLQHTISGTLMAETQPDVSESNLFIVTFQPFLAAFLVRFAQIRSCAFPREPRFPERVRMPSASVAWDLESARRNSPGASSSSPSSPQELPESPTVSGASWEVPPRKMRGMSMSADESLKQKRKFRLRFWSREPAVSTSMSS